MCSLFPGFLSLQVIFNLCAVIDPFFGAPQEFPRPTTFAHHTQVTALCPTVSLARLVAISEMPLPAHSLQSNFEGNFMRFFFFTSGIFFF